MDVKNILRAAQKFTINNSPAILTGIGVAGTITTAILAGRASYSSALLLETALIEKRQTDRGTLTTQEKVAVVYKEFIPAAVVGTVTILAIIGANHVSSKRAAALAAAFKISEQMADEYRQKTVEKLGKKTEEEMRSELAKDRMDRTPGRDVIILGEGKTMFFDEMSGRYFESTRQRIDSAVNQINYQLNQTFCASLTEFYDLLDLPKCEFSDELGWNSDELLAVEYVAVMMEDGQPALAIRYNTNPFRFYEKCR